MLNTVVFGTLVIGAAVALALVWALRRLMRIADAAGAIDNT
jgi:hypothetical protein